MGKKCICRAFKHQCSSNVFSPWLVYQCILKRKTISQHFPQSWGEKVTCFAAGQYLSDPCTCAYHICGFDSGVYFVVLHYELVEGKLII